MRAAALWPEVRRILASSSTSRRSSVPPVARVRMDRPSTGRASIPATLLVQATPRHRHSALGTFGWALEAFENVAVSTDANALPDG